MPMAMIRKPWSLPPRSPSEFRQKFKKPVVIDMFCYRRFGHNETDEPFFTQPLMYKAIAAHETIVNVYAKRLIAEGVITAEEFEAMKADYRKSLDEDFAASEGYKANKADWLDGRWSGMKSAKDLDDPRKGQTGVDLKTLKDIGLKITKVPKTFAVHQTMQRVLDARRKMIEEGVGIDWSMGENLAFATLLNDGFRVRLSGQDVQRGTFSQRHAVLVDQQTEKLYTPLNHLVKDQQSRSKSSIPCSRKRPCSALNMAIRWPSPIRSPCGKRSSAISPMARRWCSTSSYHPASANGCACRASSACLPHGYEGQGPEHSSARLERFLQMCAEDNMQIANCTTPANYFHILRRQLKRDIRKPLIMMTPKSLLRNKRATSRLEEFAEGTSFHRILWDDAETLKDQPIKLVPDDKIRRVVMCSGKVYYDLYEEREKRGITDIYLLRVEQLYPWPHKALIQELARFKAAEFVWCQEEPMNMGAWTYAQPNIDRVLDYLKATNAKARYAGRNPSASTATGLMSRHLKELKEFLEVAALGVHAKQ